MGGDSLLAWPESSFQSPGRGAVADTVGIYLTHPLVNGKILIEGTSGDSSCQTITAAPGCDLAGEEDGRHVFSFNPIAPDRIRIGTVATASAIYRATFSPSSNSNLPLAIRSVSI